MRPVPATTALPRQHVVAVVLHDGVGLAGQQRLVDLQVLVSQHHTVGDDLRAGAQLDDVVLHQLVGLQFDDLAVAHDAGARCVDDSQLIEHAAWRAAPGTTPITLLATMTPANNASFGDPARITQCRQDCDDEVDRREHVGAHDLADAAGRRVGDLVRQPLGDTFADLGCGEPGCRVSTRVGHAVTLPVPVPRRPRPLVGGGFGTGGTGFAPNQACGNVTA